VTYGAACGEVLEKTLPGAVSFRQPTVAACCGGRYISFLGALRVLVTATAPQTAASLLAGFPDIAKLLEVIAPF
jgi:hypothetical protein